MYNVYGLQLYYLQCIIHGDVCKYSTLVTSTFKTTTKHTCTCMHTCTSILYLTPNNANCFIHGCAYMYTYTCTCTLYIYIKLRNEQSELIYMYMFMYILRIVWQMEFLWSARDYGLQLCGVYTCTCMQQDYMYIVQNGKGMIHKHVRTL